MRPPVILIGAGGHAKVLVEALRLSKVPVLGVVDADPTKAGSEFCGIIILGGDEIVLGHDPAAVLLVNGLGSVGLPADRQGIFERFKRHGFRFETVIHPSAVVPTDCVLGEGSQVMAGAVIQPGTQLGVNCIVNTHASIDHDCKIGNHVHLAPGVTLSGNVVVGDTVHLGTGAVVIQGIMIGSHCQVAAGAVVVSDLKEGTTVAGVPARIRRNAR